MLRAYSIFILAIICLSGIVNTHAMFEKMQKESQKVDKMQGNSKMTEAHYERRMQAINTWRPLKIYFDLTDLKQGASNRIAFYKKVFEITGAWWGEALYIRDSRKEASDYIRQQARYSSKYRFNFTSGGQDDYDLFVKTSVGNDSGTTLAYAGPSLRHPTTQRPITGTTAVTPFGDKSFQEAEDSVNRAVGTMIHEFGHVIAFISFKNVQKRFVKMDYSIESFVWTGPIALEKARSYYGCSSLKGIPLQTKPGNKVGGHWSETFMNDELMSPSSKGGESEKVSPMTLALCEDTGWYKANYNVSENFTYMKGMGCEVKERCPNPPICKIGSKSFITSDYKGRGYCKQGKNGCPYEAKYRNKDCMRGGWPSKFAKFGASYGKNCSVAEGKFYRYNSKSVDAESYTVGQALCNSSMTSYTLTFKKFRMFPDKKYKGDAVVTCRTGGKVEFNASHSMKSYVNCQDPRTFCQARFGANGSSSTAKCDESCNMNGRCQPPVSTTRRRVRRRILQGASSFICPGGVTPIPVPKPVSKPVSNPKWKCWCYSNYKTTTGSCADLPEDKD